MQSKKKRSREKKREIAHMHTYECKRESTRTQRWQHKKYLLKKNSLIFSLNQIPTTSHSNGKQNIKTEQNLHQPWKLKRDKLV